MVTRPRLIGNTCASGGRLNSHSGDVLSREGIGGVADQKTRLTNGAAVEMNQMEAHTHERVPSASVVCVHSTHPSPTTTHLMACIVPGEDLTALSRISIQVPTPRSICQPLSASKNKSNLL